MAVKHPLMLATGNAVSSFSLTPKVGESILVTGVYVDPLTADNMIVTTNKTTVGYFAIGDIYANHLSFPTKYSSNINILEHMIALGIMNGYPVADGETITFSSQNGSDFNIMLQYEIYDASDIHSDDPNGSSATEYTFVNYGQASSIASSLTAEYDKTLDPTEFPSFPFNEVVPSKTTITIYGIAGSPVAVSSGTNANVQITNYLKFIKERTVLFDEAKNGLTYYSTNGDVTTDGTYYGGNSLIGSSSANDDRPFFVFPKPLVFQSGDELNLYLTTSIAKGVANFTADNTTLALVETVKIGS